MKKSTLVILAGRIHRIRQLKLNMIIRWAFESIFSHRFHTQRFLKEIFFHIKNSIFREFFAGFL